MFERDKLKIAVQGIRKNESDGKCGNFWTKGGMVLIDDKTIKLNYLGTLAIFSRKTVKYYRDNEEEKLLIKRIVRLYDGEQDFSVAMFPSAFAKFIKAMK